MIRQPTRPRFLILVDDMRSALEAMEPDSVDSVVCDPPYEYGFMGKAWDSTGVAFDPASWAACLRVLKPGGHLLAFGATRTVHRIACAIEDAGFDIRDQIAWMFGSGFPKSLDVSKAIDKAAGATRAVIGPGASSCPGLSVDGVCRCGNNSILGGTKHAPATAPATLWQGWGTALKPAMEPIIVARKPLAGTVAANVLAHGTGAINVDGCRVGNEERVNQPMGAPLNSYGGYGATATATATATTGRWPANVILDDEAGRALDDASGARASGARASGVRKGLGYHSTSTGDGGPAIEASTGGASRFFYSAKADGAERDAGLERLPVVTRAALVDRDEGSAGIANARGGRGELRGGDATHTRP